MPDAPARQFGRLLQRFKPKLWKRILFSVAGVALVIHYIYLISGIVRINSGVIVFMTMMGMLYGFMLLTISMSVSQRLDVHEAGLVYHFGNRRTFVPWDNMARIMWREQGRSSVLGIETKQPLEDDVPSWAIERFLHRHDDQFLIITGTVDVPARSSSRMHSRVTVDMTRLAQTEFGRILSNRAPHVFPDNMKIEGRNP